MREPNVEGDVPITVSGTYNRPNLSLTFARMVFDGHDVLGTFQPIVQLVRRRVWHADADRSKLREITAFPAAGGDSMKRAALCAPL